MHSLYIDEDKGKTTNIIHTNSFERVLADVLWDELRIIGLVILRSISLVSSSYFDQITETTLLGLETSKWIFPHKRTEHSRLLFSDQITLPIRSIYMKESKRNIQLCPRARLGFKVTHFKIRSYHV